MEAVKYRHISQVSQVGTKHVGPDEESSGSALWLAENQTQVK